MSTEYPLPIIHTNGTGAVRLSDDYAEARSKLREAENAFNSIDFNGRDYYPHEDGSAFHQARSAREEVAVKFAEIATYLDKHLAHLEDARCATESKEAFTGLKPRKGR